MADDIVERLNAARLTINGLNEEGIAALDAIHAAAAEIERLRASEAQAAADADALANFSTRDQRFGTFEMTWDDYVRARTDAVPALSRAAERRAKKEASDAER